MIVDALLEADKALRFSDKIHSVRDFVTLDDSLLKAIENFHLYNPGCGNRFNKGRKNISSATS